MIVLDEPSTGLDPESRTRVWEELAVLQQAGVTVLMSTHYMEEAQTLCDRIAVLHSGRILDEGTPPELVARHAGSRVAEIRLVGASREVVRKTLAEAGLQAREVGTLFRVAAPDGAAFGLPELPRGVRVAWREANLEDVFLALAGRRLADA